MGTKSLDYDYELFWIKMFELLYVGCVSFSDDSKLRESMVVIFT